MVSLPARAGKCGSLRRICWLADMGFAGWLGWREGSAALGWLAGWSIRGRGRCSAGTRGCMGTAGWCHGRTPFVADCYEVARVHALAHV